MRDVYTSEVVSLTGRIAVETGGRRLDEGALSGRRPRLAFAFLVAERGRAVPREELAEVLWGDRLPDSWRPSLREVVSKVRAFLRAAGLPHQVLASRFGCYQLQLPERIQVDIELAADAAGEAERALQSGALDRALALAEQACAVAGRPFLPGEHSSWADDKRDELRGTLARALAVAAECRLARGEPSRAVPLARRLIQLEPFREDAHVRLMRAHAAAGNRAEALRAYDRCRRALREELGVNPSPQAEAAFLGLLRANAPAPTPTPSRAPADGGARPSPVAVARWLPFVGRELELARLGTAWEAAGRGAFSLALVGGEAGIGKTRLADQLAERVAAGGGLVLYGRCEELPLAPFQPFTQALEGLPAALPGDVLDPLWREHGADLARLLPTAARLRGAPPATPASPELERYRLFTGAVALLHAATRTAPVLLILDDLHWADAATQRLLDYVAGSSATLERLLVVGLYRTDPPPPAVDPRETLAFLDRRGAVEQLDLGGLAPEELALAVEEWAGTSIPQAAEPVLRAVHDQTGGNPFFAGEIIRHVFDRRSLCAIDKAAPRSAGAGVVSLPTELRAVVGDRVARLSAASQAAVEAAAVGGQEVELARLRSVCAEPGALAGAIDEAVAAGLLAPATAPGRIRFQHAIVQAAVEARIPPMRRRDLHRRWAEALAAASGDARPLELARHWTAGAPGDDKAVDAAVTAARAAQEALAYEEAVRYWELALQQLALGAEQTPRRRGELLIGLADACRRAGQMERSGAVFLEAADLARRAGDATLLARAAEALASLRYLSPVAMSTVRTLVDEALGALGEGGGPLRAELQSWRAALLSQEGRGTEARAAANAAAAAAAHSGDPEATSAALLGRLEALAAPPWVAERLTVADEVADLARSRGDRRLLLAAMAARIHAKLELGDAREAAAGATEHARLAQDAGDADARLHAVFYRVLDAGMEGRFQDVDARIGEVALAARRAFGDQAPLWAVVLAVMVPRLLQGRFAEVAPQLRMVATRLPELPTSPWAKALAATGDAPPEEARWEVERAMVARPPAEIPMDGEWSMTMFCAAEASVRTGTPELAAELVPLLRPYEHLNAVFRGRVFYGAFSLHLGRLAAVQGDWDEATDQLEHALARHSAMGARPWSVLTQRALAEALQARGEESRAAKLRREYEAASDRLGIAC